MQKPGPALTLAQDLSFKLFRSALESQMAARACPSLAGAPWEVT
jgi:hypothetical protein